MDITPYFKRKVFCFMARTTITPQSNLQIMRGIPWTNDYKHTRFFDTISAQETYMSSKVVSTLQYSDFTYIREQNVIRVPVCADDLYNCNYLRYKNTGFGTKWFYAFITDIKYVNNNTSEISFEIDQFQTWWFNVDLDNCYVEREHVADDTIGLHIIDEDIGTGEIAPQVTHYRYWKYNSQDSSEFGKGLSLLVQVKPTLVGSFLGDQQPFKYRHEQVVPNYDRFNQPIDDTTLANALTGSTFTGADIGDAVMFPYELSTPPVGGIVLDTELTTNNIKRPTSYKMSPSQYDNNDQKYTPKNNKLFTYPYTYLLVRSSDGNDAKYKWEDAWGGDDHITFELSGCEYNEASCYLRPTNYHYKKEDMLHNVPINNFPKVSLGQFEQLKWGNLLTGALGIVGSGINSVVSGKPFGVISETAQFFTGLATDTPDKDYATTGNSALMRDKKFGYEFYVMGIYGQNAKVIDDYLTRFGYKVNCIKVPALHSRKRWNYVKTKECEISAKTTGNNIGAPNDAIKQMQDMFNAGVTLWHVNDVGNFSGDNGIRT